MWESSELGWPGQVGHFVLQQTYHQNNKFTNLKRKNFVLLTDLNILHL